MTAIKLEELSRSFLVRSGFFRTSQKIIPALDGVSLTVKRGELFGIVGPNGAGKTTLIKILTTLLLPTSGSAFVMGLDVTKRVREVRQRVGYARAGWQVMAHVGDAYGFINVSRDYERTANRPLLR